MSTLFSKFFAVSARILMDFSYVSTEKTPKRKTTVNRNALENIFSKQYAACLLLTSKEKPCTMAKKRKGNTAMAVVYPMVNMISIQQRIEIAQISTGLYCRTQIFG